jgi:hypothetical protein
MTAAAKSSYEPSSTQVPQPHNRAPKQRDGRRPATATYRKVSGGFRSDWGADLFAAVRSVIGTARRRGFDAYQAIRNTLQGQGALAPG